MIDKPHAPSCERNREPILAVLEQHFADRRHVLEVGSGTGQHAVAFAAAMPWLTWQCSDRAEYLMGIGQWLAEAGLANTPPAVELDVGVRPWPPFAWPATGESERQNPLRVAFEGGLKAGAAMDTLLPASRPRLPAFEPPLLSGRSHCGRFDAAFSANTLHIMGWTQVEALFAGLDTALADDATLVVYGPFNHGGAFTSDSNRAFDASLKARDARMGLRDFEAVDGLANAIGLMLVDDRAMPANNRCLVWRRKPRGTSAMPA